MLDPVIWSDEGFLELSIPARLLFIGLISHADDEGRGTASARSLRARIFPGDTLSDDEIRTLCEEVAAHMRCTFYACANTEYYQLAKWYEYQRMRMTAESTIPPCDEPMTNRCSTDDAEGGEGRKEGRMRRRRRRTSMQRCRTAATLALSASNSRTRRWRT